LPIQHRNQSGAEANLFCHKSILFLQRFALFPKKRFVHIAPVRAAIAALVNRILEVRNPEIWGNSTACASDGKHLGAWDQNLVAEWNPHYQKSGIMTYWHVDSNATCIYSQLKTPTSSEVAAMIKGLIHHDTEMRVESNFVDSHGQSEED
jgi:TnpA family transposase